MTKGVNELLQFFCVTCMLLVPVFCGWERVCTPGTARVRREGICGNELTEVLSLVCSSRPAFKKRNTSPQIDQRHLDPEEDLDNNFADQQMSTKDFIQKQDAASFLVKKSLHSRSIVCECCIHQCTLFEMQEYCSSSGGYNKRSHSLSTPALQKYIDMKLKGDNPKY